VPDVPTAGGVRRTVLRPAKLALAAALVALPVTAYLLGRRHAAPPGPAASYRQLTFRRGYITAARFAPDGQTIVFSAAWEGTPLGLYTTRLEFPESQPLGSPNSTLLALSQQGELAMIQKGEPSGHLTITGTVSRAALAGGAPREILERVRQADWGPGGRDLAVVHHTGNKDSLEFPVGKLLLETTGWVGWPRVSPARRTDTSGARARNLPRSRPTRLSEQTARKSSDTAAIALISGRTTFHSPIRSVMLSTWLLSGR